jgi:hypothetical protein
VQGFYTLSSEVRVYEFTLSALDVSVVLERNALFESPSKFKCGATKNHDLDVSSLLGYRGHELSRSVCDKFVILIKAMVHRLLVVLLQVL